VELQAEVVDNVANVAPGWFECQRSDLVGKHTVTPWFGMLDSEPLQK
jgi:hypothetical protein